MDEIKVWDFSKKTRKNFSQKPFLKHNNRIIYGRDIHGFMFLAKYDSIKDLIKYNNKLYEPHIVFIAISSKEVNLNDSNYNIRLNDKNKCYNTVYFSKNHYEKCKDQIKFVKAAINLHKSNIVEFISLDEGKRILSDNYKQFKEMPIKYAECVTYDD